ncbi:MULTISPECIES: iron-containing alcohol dehydrogenase [unclassified Ketobacter]|uniref:iron-containing alcohol dehydrogenase n=1 Tax=unclassified Ketobacter TaxID=2639109 RepID=UPI000F0D6EE2|nr:MULTISPECIES: iron-containing alcohol dehydrogenase [unclassified Ketobacter]RLT88494.1 MAG: iron-containing alcohol dehydrogenase [Ketobacter sp. GenoA1]RLT95432.1 MAG: iron-containing alcohol dehydrogenase [Ketobacter sp.]
MTKSYYEFFCPVKLVAGNAALEHIPYELRTLSSSRPMIITDKGVRGAGLIDHVLGAFAESGMDVIEIYDDVPPDSSTTIVKDIAKLYRDSGCDSIIAVGGGSVIDTSKGVNILVSEDGEDLSDFSGVGVLTKPLNPFFVVPTTAGTGSEVTLVAVISDPEKGVKLPFTSYFLLPNAAILDPRMTLTLPAHITAMTAMDAMTHAVEAFTCMGKNPISDAYAMSAIKKISENLIKVLNTPDDAEARLELAQASTMAGVAFSNSMVGLVHSLGHSLGALCHLPHGLCMNLFLPYVLEYNLAERGEIIGELLLPLAGAEVYAQTPAVDRGRAAINTIREIRDELHRRCKLPRTLSETGKVTKDQIAKIAEMALDDGSIIYNPVEVDLQDAIAVLENAW